MSKDEKVRKFLLTHTDKLSHEDWKKCMKSEIDGEAEMATSMLRNQ